MDDISARVLSRLSPDVFAPDGAGWQERRSAETRLVLLEATITSLVDLGYARTSTKTIADFAGLTRGAMGHHFASKLDLIAAVIDFIGYWRMETYILEIDNLQAKDRGDPSIAMELYTQNSDTREYRAYLELMVASRSDAELRAVFTPKARRYRQLWLGEMARIFPGWEGKEVLLYLCSDFGTLINEALLLNRDVIDSPATREALKQLSAKVIQMVRDGEIVIADARSNTLGGARAMQAKP